jgi:hypothetical protein
LPKLAFTRYKRVENGSARETSNQRPAKIAGKIILATILWLNQNLPTPPFSCRVQNGVLEIVQVMVPLVLTVLRSLVPAASYKNSMLLLPLNVISVGKFR